MLVVAAVDLKEVAPLLSEVWVLVVAVMAAVMQL
jgi:hypothetical protein